MARHTRHFQREIEKLKKMILSMGSHVEENVQNSVIAVTERDSALAIKVIESDKAIDEREVEVEEECLKLLALYQPVANDLRMIVAILKINNDLERIGDLAVNIAERAVFLCTQDPIDMPEPFGPMAGKSQWMVRKSLDALINSDAGQARVVCAADDEVDDMNRNMFSQVGGKIRAHPDLLDPYMNFLSASRYLERVADHATNVAEDVIYMVEGQIIRHNKEFFNPSPEPPAPED